MVPNSVFDMAIYQSGQVFSRTLCSHIHVVSAFFFGGPYPFQKRRVFYIRTGGKWPYATKLKRGDVEQNGCYRVKRNFTTYALKGNEYKNLHTMDVKKPDLFCTERDMLGLGVYIINKVEYGEALEAYLKPENTEELLEVRVLLYPSEEINRNLTRLFGIVPLVFQANQLKNWSAAFSIIIIIIDFISNVIEKHAWVPLKLKLKDFIKSQLAGFKNRSFRSSLSKYLSSVSPSLLYTDNFTCNFKKVVPGEVVWIMPNTYLEGEKSAGFYNPGFDSIERYRMTPEEVEPLLVEESRSFIDKHNEAEDAKGRKGYFEIPKGSKKYTIHTRQGELKCIFVPSRRMAYNFLNGVELHWGPYNTKCTDLIISFLRLIHDSNYLPFTMSIKRTYKTDGFDRVFSHVASGGWFMKATAIHAGLVS